MGKTLADKKKGFTFPHVFIILMIIMLIVTVLSWVIPSGQFGATELGTVDPNQFTYIKNDTPITLISFFSAIPTGIINSATIIVCLLVCTGVIKIIEETGAIAAGLQKLTGVARGKEAWLIVLMTLVFGIMGVIGFGEGALPFVPMMVSVSLALGFDRIVGVGAVQLGVAVGFTTGAFNLFTTGICQQLAGLTMFSAWEFRLAEFGVCFLILAVFMYRYCKRIKKDPSKSVMPDYRQSSAAVETTAANKANMTWQRAVTLFLLLFTFVFQSVGAIALGWNMQQISGLYLIVAILVVLVNRVQPNKACIQFCQGSVAVIPAILAIGFARAIYELMAQAKIVDTIIHTIANVFQGKSPLVIIILLYLVVIAFNFFVVSASGKAMILFPILKPLADILGINQQVVVTAFQLGDGFTNYLFPSSGALMAALELGGVTYQQWVKFTWKFITLMVVVGAGLSLIAQAINLGPF